MRNEKGFTLIELLVVVAIVGILAAIAIPQFAAYRTRAFNSNAESDLRNGITAQEAAFVDNEAYQTCTSQGDCETDLPGFKGSSGVGDGKGTYTHTAGSDGQDFTAQAVHDKGDKTYDYDSTTGLIAES